MWRSVLVTTNFYYIWFKLFYLFILNYIYWIIHFFFDINQQLERVATHYERCCLKWVLNTKRISISNCKSMRGWKLSWLHVKNRVQLKTIMKDQNFGLHSPINHVINNVPKRNIIAESQYTIEWPDMRLQWSKAPRKITTNIDKYVIIDSIIYRLKRKKL